MAAKKKEKRGKVAGSPAAIGVFFSRFESLRAVIERFGPEARVIDVIRAWRA